MRWILGAIALITLFAYRSVFFGYFLADDLSFLSFLAAEHEQGTLGRTLLTGFASPPVRGANFYRPVVDLSFALDFLFWGTTAWGWHLTNLLLHLTNAMLLAAIVAEVLRETGSHDSLAPVAAAAIFALNPLAPESVAWISGRSDELALAAMLASLLLYLRSGGWAGPTWTWSVLFFAWALASKEAAVTLPGWIAGVHLAGWKGGWRRTVRAVLPYAQILGIYFFVRFIVFKEAFTIYEVPEIRLSDPGWVSGKLHALRVFAESSSEPVWSGRATGALAYLGIGLGLIAAMRSVEARRLFAMGALWLVATLLPLVRYLWIEPSGENARLLYIPSAALSVLLAAPLAWKIPAEPALRAAWTVSRLGVAARVALSLPLLWASVSPWSRAGTMMSKVVPAISDRADQVPDDSKALLLLPDALDSAIFARNSQGPLMEPPVQQRSLEQDVLVLTSRSAGSQFEQIMQWDDGLQRHPTYCWDDVRQEFSRMALPGRSAIEPEAVRRAAAKAGCAQIAREY